MNDEEMKKYEGKPCFDEACPTCGYTPIFIDGFGEKWCGNMVEFCTWSTDEKLTSFLECNKKFIGLKERQDAVRNDR